jgi:enoyl-CoA hydratase/carnithine racemase
VSELVSLQLTDGIATILLERPPMNALSFAVHAALKQAAEGVTSNPDVRVVVLYGGPTVFAAGADVPEMAGKDYSEIAGLGAMLHTGFNTVAAIPKPVVAAITGFALGGGLELALCADFRVCGESAKLGVPEILLGIIPGLGGTQRLPRLIGSARAKDLVFTGRQVGASEALHIGLVDQVVPDDEVYDAATRLASRFTAGPAQALRAAKEAIDGGLDLDLDAGLRVERHLFASLFATEDQKRGMSSFAENGPGKAVFVGK